MEIIKEIYQEYAEELGLDPNELTYEQRKMALICHPGYTGNLSFLLGDYIAKWKDSDVWDSLDDDAPTPAQ